MKKPKTNTQPIQPRAGLLAKWQIFTCAALTLIAASTQAQIIFTPVFSNVWNVVKGSFLGNVGDFADLPGSGAANNVRGFAISPVTTNVLFASTLGGTNGGASHVATLSFASGSNYLGQAVGTGISFGTLALDQVRVSDDGFVYACNLSGAPASDFKIYRWPSDTDFTTAPIVVYDSGAGTSFQWRLGDYMDLRGSGINTEIVLVGNGSGANITTNFVIFRPTDSSATTFTNFSIFIPGSSATVNLCGGGVAFEGTNNVIYVKRTGSTTVTRVVYNPATLTAQVTNSYAVDQTAANGLKFYQENGVKMLAMVTTATTSVTNGTAHNARVFQLTGPSSLVSVLNQPLPTPFQTNGNSLGLVDFQKGYVVFSEPNNNIAFYQLGFITNSPPTLGGNAAGGTLIEGFNFTFSVTASGSSPLSYQWYFNTNTPIAGANTNSYTLSPVQLTNAGTYSVIVTNTYGRTTSSLASITVLPQGYSLLATQLWSLPPGSRDYLTTGDTQRGLAYDPIYQRIVVVSRAPTNGVHLLDANTGADQGDMDISPLLAFTPPGTFPINMCGVADDGAVYVGNLLTSTASDSFAIYRWDGATNTATMTQAYVGNPAVGRIGDTMAVRGAGLNTEILCSFRTGTNVAVFTTTDGVTFNINILAVTNLPADAQANGFAGLGIAFGSGNTFWAKSSGFNLRQVEYDVAAGTANVVVSDPSLPATEAPLAVDNANGYVALVAFGETPQNLPIYDLQAAGGPSLASLLDRELFGANNANANGTGSAAFDIAGGRLFALDSNNGLLGLIYAPRLYISPTVQGGVVTWTGPGTLQSSTNVIGTYLDVVATSPYTNTAASQLYFRVRR